MNQLTLEHVSAYLPWKVKCNLTRPRFERYNIDLMGLTIAYNECSNEHYIMKSDVTYGLNHIQLILRPLSKLTKPITVDGETFVPIKKLGWSYYGGEYGNVTSCEYGESPKVAINVLDYMDDLKKLLSWHFDIYNLIPQGLAIDINTLK